jgi:hypothetical protein
MKKRKIYLVLLIITFSFILSACNVLQSGRYIRNDRKTANEMLFKIVELIEKKDKEGLKKLFSKQTLETANDIDGGIDYVMNFYEGNMISSDDNPCIVTSEKSDFGKKTIQLDCSYKIVTDKSTYWVFFLYITKDTSHPNNVGLYRLGVLTEDDRNNVLNTEYHSTIGVYRP